LDGPKAVFHVLILCSPLLTSSVYFTAVVVTHKQHQTKSPQSVVEAAK